MREQSRRDFLSLAAAVVPADMLANVPPSDRSSRRAPPTKIIRFEAILLEKPLAERFWMSISPIGGMKPKAKRLILKAYTDSGIVGYGEGSGGGAELVRQGLPDLVVGEDPFMVGRVWEKLFALTYDRELVKRGWSREGVVAAIAAIDAALYDTMSKAAGQPLYKFLGGYRNS